MKEQAFFVLGALAVMLGAFGAHALKGSVTPDTLYAMALTGISALGAITPLGGLALIFGWALLFAALPRKSED